MPPIKKSLAAGSKAFFIGVKTQPGAAKKG
jgi:hypothetical protein